jgi:hypothetical protein
VTGLVTNVQEHGARLRLNQIDLQGYLHRSRSVGGVSQSDMLATST